MSTPKTALLFYAMIGSLFCPLIASANIVNVNNTTELQSALKNAQAGTQIQLADGLYSKAGGFALDVGVSGSETEPIVIFGSSNAILSSGNLNSGTALSLKGLNDYVQIKGLSFKNSLKGIEIYESRHVLIDSVRAVYFGQEAIHFLKFSQHNTLQNSWIDSTGMVTADYGEGVYIGSAESNWATKSNGAPDSSNYNTIQNNHFGDFVAAENIDIKEGTRGGLILNNQFNGKGLQNKNSADSWIDVKGNSYKIISNIGNNSFLDGMQSHINYANFGDSNLFFANQLNVNNTGYGINIQTTGSRGTASHNIVCDNNTQSGALSGLSNIIVTPLCLNPLPVILKHPAQLPFKIEYSQGKIKMSSQEHMAHFSVKLQNLLGRTIQNLDLYNGEIDVSFLTPGIYLLWGNGWIWGFKK